MTANPEFKKKFSSKLELPVFINDELVTFGQTYAKENGYKLDEMGILALYSRIDVMQREDHAVSVAEVKEIMDEAIAHSQKANVKHLARRVFGKGTDDSDRIILIEEDFKQPFIVTNCDILIHADYENIYRYHRESGNELTIVSALKNIVVPYGVIHSSENGAVQSMEEKPKLSYFVNTGMYILNPDLKKEIPENTFYHMTDLTDK